MNLWGYKRSSLSKCVVFWPDDVLCSCSVPESVSKGWIYSVLVAHWLGSHGLVLPEWEWRWFTLLQHIRLAGLQCWHENVYTAKWLRNKSKKISFFVVFLLVFFSPPPRNLSPKGFFCCWAQLLYKVTEMESLQQHDHVAWEITWDSFFLGIQHIAWCHCCFVSSGAPKTSHTNVILHQSSAVMGQ